MRISGGEFKRRELKTPKGNDTRPSSGITRESIFNILAEQVRDAFILDLFAGSGSLGIEAISRGASFCVFAEADMTPVKCIKDNIKKLNIENKTLVLKKELPSQVNTLFLKKKPDIIFMDPPYSKGFIEETLKELKKNDLVKESTTIIVEHSKKEIPETEFFKLLDTRKYGKSLVSFLNYML